MRFNRFSYFVTIEEITLSNIGVTPVLETAPIKVSDCFGLHLIGNAKGEAVTIAVERAVPTNGAPLSWVEMDRVFVGGQSTAPNPFMVYEEDTVAFWRLRVPNAPAGTYVAGNISGGGA